MHWIGENDEGGKKQAEDAALKYRFESDSRTSAFQWQEVMGRLTVKPKTE